MRDVYEPPEEPHADSGPDGGVYYHPMYALAEVHLHCPNCDHELLAVGGYGKLEQVDLQCSNCGTVVMVTIPAVTAKATNELIQSGKQGWYCEQLYCGAAISLGNDMVHVCKRCNGMFCSAHIVRESFGEYYCQFCAALRTQARPCDSCGALLYDLTYPKTGKRAPIEAQPVVGGNIEIDRFAGTYTLVPKEQRGSGVFARELYKSHFYSCPQAKEWKPGGARRSGPTHRRRSS